ncbi:MAG: CooT family nickel-binding protein [Deltaproteobacteria bacterium]|nr:CooT family nickel-binding protein [Deltaproteobacteria bacterium]
MCEVKVYLNKNGKEELVMEDVGLIEPKGNKIDIQDIFGDKKSVKGEIIQINLLTNKVFIKGK